MVNSASPEDRRHCARTLSEILIDVVQLTVVLPPRHSPARRITDKSSVVSNPRFM